MPSRTSGRSPSPSASPATGLAVATGVPAKAPLPATAGAATTPAVASSASVSTPAASPAAATSTKKRTVPVSPPEPSFLYPQSIRKSGDSQKEYGERLADNEYMAAKVQTQPTPGSFSLLTQRSGNMDMTRKALAVEKNRTKHEAPWEPKEGKVEYTGEVRFDKEIQTIREREALVKRLLEELHDHAKKLKVPPNRAREQEYFDELRNIPRAIEALQKASGLHYAAGSFDESRMASDPVHMTDNELLHAINYVQRVSAKKETARMSQEIRSKRDKEFNQLKQMVETLSAQNQTIKKAYMELVERYRRLLGGKAPITKEAEETLLDIDAFMRHILDNYKTGGEVIIIPEEKAVEAKEIIDSILSGTFSEPAKLEAYLSPNEILAELSAEGKDITKATLVAKGMPEIEAEGLIELLKKEGIIT